ncbi:MAG: CBS domain-containing protein [Xanthobacteraceae bacterium]
MCAIRGFMSTTSAGDGHIRKRRAFNCHRGCKNSEQSRECSCRDTTLLPTMTVKEAIAIFDKAEAEALAVVHSQDRRHVAGLLSESHALRRYAEELELRRKELIGE